MTSARTVARRRRKRRARAKASVVLDQGPHNREGSPNSDPSSKNCFQWMRGGKSLRRKAKSTPAAPVVAIIDSDDGAISSGSEWEEADTDASTGDDAAVSESAKPVKKVSFSKGTSFVSSRSVHVRGGKVRKVDVGKLYDLQRTEQVYDGLRALQ